MTETKRCFVCGDKLTNKTKYTCSNCGKVLCGKHSFTYVDGNNGAITKNGPILCRYIKGRCSHGCTYCYMTAINKRFNKAVKEPYLDEKELNKNLGSGNIIFVGSSTDMWAKNIPDEWILKSLEHITKYYKNTYLFQSKNPGRFIEFFLLMPRKCRIGTTIETNRQYGYMGNTPSPEERAWALKHIRDLDGIKEQKTTFITIEPIINFDDRFIELIKIANPHYINIGADSGNNHLPEPEPEKIRELIKELEKFTKVNLKKNLRRLLPEHELYGGKIDNSQGIV